MASHPPHRRPPAGFTLIEMMTVVVVLGIAASLILPRLRSTSSIRAVWAAELLAADLQAAQSESMAHPDDPRVLVISADASRYHLAAASDPATPITNPLEQKPWVVEFGKGRARHLHNVVLPTTNIGADLTLGFGTYGELDQSHDAVFVLGANASIVTLTIASDTGQVTLSQLQSAAADLANPLPGPVDDVSQWNNYWNALLAGSTSEFNNGNR